MGDWTEDFTPPGGRLSKKPIITKAQKVILNRLRPFEPGEYIDNGDGSYSTERTQTVQAPDGAWINVPSLWMSPGGYVDLADDEDGIVQAATAFESRMGLFPRHKTLEEAVVAAKARSAGGGAFNGPQK